LGWQPALARAASHNQLPATYIRGTGGMAPEALRTALQEEDIALQPTLLRSCFRVETGNIVRTDLFIRGELAIQDLASQMIPLLLDVRPGQRVLDLCAAPGNKTSLLALAAGSKGTVIAGDLHAHRLQRWAPPNSRANTAPVLRLALDGSQPLPLRGTFDRVLVDAPCSGTGTLRRNPEIKWRLRPENITELARLQQSLLQQAAAAVSPGGRLVYSTCSYEWEENQQVVKEFLAEHPKFRLVPLRSQAARLQQFFTSPRDPLVAELLGGDFLATSPEKHQSDGFFAAIVERAG
jgi:16S rRNA (cytosine967-C5)-methyltransferase